MVKNLRNLRDPRLELGSVYEDAPRRDQMFLKAGSNATGGGIPGEVPPDPADLERDLPRGADRKAQIGDPRNDGNLIVAPLHTAVLRFHNAAVDWVLANEAHYQGPAAVFNRAQQLTRWHYQWLVVHDYLETLTRVGTVDRVLLGGNRHYRPEGEPFMPLEFSVAAFRFGHSMIRAGYDPTATLAAARSSGRSRASTSCSSSRQSQPAPGWQRHAALQLDHRVGPLRRQGQPLSEPLRPQDRRQPRVPVEPDDQRG